MEAITKNHRPGAGKISRRAVLALLLPLLLLGSRSAWAQWTNVPSVNFATLSLSQFNDLELEVPYFLNFFAPVANAVIETGTNRGFLDIKVNREPADNQPYNARVMENQLSLAYFYTANRPWNVYRGNAAVRVRLEAMLDRWTRIQNQPGSADGDFDGLFNEYSWNNWSLAPTGFGVRAAAEAIDLIKDSGLPFDATILENARVSLRNALMALFTRTDMRNAAKQYSNQLGGAYHAAMIYLENWPDAALDAALAATLQASSAQDQSPAGYWYEQGGPDFGYTTVHDNNFRIALTRLRNRADLMLMVTNDDAQWNDWLSANMVPQPDVATRTFLCTAGINTRTSYSYLNPTPRPISEFVPQARSFAYTDTEYAAYLVTRRSQVQSQFGNWGTLAVPSSSSYQPGFVHDAVTNLNVWNPTAAQRAAADINLASASTNALNQVRRDPLPVFYNFARRPQYYAALTTGNIRVTRQAYGLGLLWNARFGAALQSVAATSWIFGTRRAGMSGTFETNSFSATITAGGVTISPTNGINNLPAGDFVLSYPLAESGTTYGQKTVTFGDSAIAVNLTHSGSFSELLPLAHASDAVVSNTAGRVILTRPNGASLTIEVATPGAIITVGGTSTLTTGLVRRMVTISGSGSLDYRLTLNDGVVPPPALVANADTVVTGGSTPRFIDVLGNDTSSAGMPVMTTASAAVNGQAAIVGQQIWYVPAVGFSGNDTFNYVITNGALSATGLVTVAVGGPVLLVNSAQLSASDAQVGNPAVNVLDGDLNTRWSAQNTNNVLQWLQFDLLSTQLVRGVSLAFWPGTNRFAYFSVQASGNATNWTDWLTNASSSGVSSNLENFAFTPKWTRFIRIVGLGNSQGTGWNSITEAKILSATNAAPVAVADLAAMSVGGAVVIPVLANDSDPDSGPQPLALVSFTQPTSGAVTAVGGGLRYAPVPGFIGADSFSYVVSDSGRTATGLVSLTVTNNPGVAPILQPFTNLNVIGGAALAMVGAATDFSAPPQRLVWSLSTAPAGSSINATSGFITWRPTVAQAGTSNLFTVVVTQAGWLNPFAPVADAFVRDGIFAGTNYGAETNLTVKFSTSTGSARESFLQFNVTNIPGALISAVLQLTPTAASFAGVHVIAPVTNAWSESVLNWTNRPGSSAVLAAWTPQLGVPVAVPLTTYLGGVLTGGAASVSFKIYGTNATADGLVNYGSREGAAGVAPQLAVTSSTGSSLTATQSFWVRVTAPQTPLLSGPTNLAGVIRFSVSGSAGPDYLVQVSTNLVSTSWTTVLVTNPAQLPFVFSESLSPAVPSRFYRVRLAP